LENTTCLAKKFTASVLAVVLWWSMSPVFPALAVQPGAGSAAVSEPAVENSVAQKVYGTDAPAVHDIPPVFTDQEQDLLPPAIIIPPLMRNARGITGVIQVVPFRTVDEIVQKATELPNSAFNYAKTTAYASQPSLTSPYAAGSLSPDDLNDALNTIKMARYLAGLPYGNITLTDSLNSSAQAKAVLLAVSNFDHYPAIPADMDGAFYNLAQRTLSQSFEGGAECIASGYANLSRSILVQSVGDNGPNNIGTADHRMIMFHPGTENFGVGYVSKPGTGSTSYYTVVHSEYPTSNCDSYVAWPSAGDFPMQYFTGTTALTSAPAFPWSLTLGANYQAPNKTTITLTLTRARDGQAWTFNANTPDLSVNASDYRNPALDHLSVNEQNIIFRPNANALGSIMEGDVFTVSLAGIKTSAGAATTLQYNINFFDLAKEMNRSRVNITVKRGSTPVQGATVSIDGQTLITNVNGLATLRVNNNSSYSYTVTAPGYETATGSVSVGSTAVSKDVPVYIPVQFTITNTNTTYNGAAQGVTVAASPNAAYTVTYNGSVTVPKNVGTYNVQVQANAPGYTGSNTATLTINKAAITVKAENKIKKIGAPDPPLTTVVTSGQLFNGDTFTGALARNQGETLGSYAINQGTLALNNNYNLTFVPGTLEILAKEPQNITVSGLGTKNYGDAPFSLNVTLDPLARLNNISFSSGNTNVATISSTGQITVKGAGTTVITVTEPGNADYAPFTWTQQLVVNKVVLQVSAANQSITYGDPLPDWTLTYAGFVNGENQNVLTTRPTVALATTGKINAGNYTLLVSGGAAGNYDFHYTNGTLTVAPKEVTVSGLSVYDKEYQAGDVSAAVKGFGYVINGMVVGDNLSINTAALTAHFNDDAIGSNKIVTISGIALTGSDKNNYHLTSTTATATANIKAALGAQDIAGGITSVPSLPPDATQVEMPVVPPGFTISISASDNAAISTNGTVAPVDVDTIVHLVFQITKTSDRTTANTVAVTVTVPASTKYTINVTAGDGGSISGSGRYNKNANVFLSATPNTGYRFDGWYENNVKIADAGAQYSFPATMDRTLQARFIADSGGSPGNNGGSSSSSSSSGSTASCTVTFAANGGSIVTSKSLAAGSKVSQPADPIREGYTFTGWYADQELTIAYDFNKAVTGNITIYAGWTENTAVAAPAPAITPAQPLTTPAADTNTAWQNPFSDVNAGDWFYSDVQYTVTNGIFNGASATTFAPKKSMTRAMFITTLWRQAGSPSGSGGSLFADVGPSAYYAQAVQWATANNIIQGSGNNLFAPNTSVTREQAAAMLYRYARLSGQTMRNTAAGKNFADEGNISSYAKNSVNLLVRQGILSGKPNNLFDPQGIVTRAEAAAMLHRFMTAARVS